MYTKTEGSRRGNSGKLREGTGVEWMDKVQKRIEDIRGSCAAGEGASAVGGGASEAGCVEDEADAGAETADDLHSVLRGSD